MSPRSRWRWLLCKRLGHAPDLLHSPWWRRRCKRCGALVHVTRFIATAAPAIPACSRGNLARFDGYPATD